MSCQTLPLAVFVRKLAQYSIIIVLNFFYPLFFVIYISLFKSYIAIFIVSPCDALELSVHIMLFEFPPAFNVIILNVSFQFTVIKISANLQSSIRPEYFFDSVFFSVMIIGNGFNGPILIIDYCLAVLFAVFYAKFRQFLPVIIGNNLLF